MTNSKLTGRTGQRFGKWLLIEETVRHFPSGAVLTYYKCRCICGREKTIEASSLKRGKSQACSWKCRTPLVGRRFGNLTVIKPTQKKYGTCQYWLCLCDCGNYREARTQQLKCGRSHSCSQWCKYPYPSTKITHIPERLRTV